MTGRLRGAVRVLDRSRHPLSGIWSQGSEQLCDGGAERTATETIRELACDAGGGFSVTREPFEVYKDYWGQCRHDLASGVISLTIKGVNRTPESLTLQGSATVTGSILKLEGVTLWPTADGRPVCALRFTRPNP